MKLLSKLMLISIFTITVVISGCFYFEFDKSLPTIQQTAHTIKSKLTRKTPISTADTDNPYYYVKIDWSAVSIDKVEVHKSKRRLDLLANNQVIKSYQMRLGFDPVGHKTTEGDGKTPEGKYILDWRNPNSKFYKSLHISYPNKADKAQAKARNVSAGGDVMIHGSAKKNISSSGVDLYNYLPLKDWTLGCIGVTNADMDEIWDNVKNGTPIEIFS